jgi:hypothetical protein
MSYRRGEGDATLRRATAEERLKACGPGRSGAGQPCRHPQPSPRRQPALGRLDEPLDDLDTRRARYESALRFVVTDIAGEPGELVGADVGGVADDAVEGPGRRGGIQQVAADQLDPAVERVTGDVGLRHREGVGGDVGGDEVCLGEVLGQRHCDGAGTGADIGDPR